MKDGLQDRHWQALLDSAAEGIWGVDLEGNCTFVNQIATESFGYGSDEIVGNNMHALTHHHYEDGSEYPDSECPVYGVFRNNKAFRQLTEAMFRKDGSSFLAEMSAQPVSVDGEVVGVVVTFRDVTEVRKQQSELKEAYALAERRTAELNAVIESIPHGVFIKTADGATRLNRRAAEMSGDQFPAQLNTMDRALKGEAASKTIRSGKTWIQSVAAPIVLKDKIIGGVAVNTDITQDRLREEMLRKSEKLAAVGQLASAIAHEINDPLESVTNLLYLIRQTESLKEIQEYAAIAQDELTRVSEITIQTLRFNRLQNNPTLVDVAELLSSIVSLYSGRLMVRGVKVDWKILPTSKVLCLEGEIRQVLNNLLRNAVEAMPTGGRLGLRVRPARDGIAGGDSKNGVRITIADSGEGISPEIAPHLFEPFYTTKDVNGTGLGLWVSKGIIDKHDGRITVCTRRVADGAPQGGGTVFALWLPEENADLVDQASSSKAS
jgi:PAS domain S-box-containing protein